MANIFTKPNVRYSNIKTDAEQKVEEEVEGDVKGITFMTSNSKKLIEALYDGQKDEAAKLLAKYIWLGTRDSTMILITTGLLVLAEKEKIAKLQNDQQRIMDLFKNMAKGNGKQAKTNCENSKEFEKAFKSILKCAPNIKDSKVDDVWKKYVRQIGKITKWYIGRYALVNNVCPVLEKSLVQKYYDVFVKNMSKSQDKKESPTTPNEENNKTTFPTLLTNKEEKYNARVAVVGDDGMDTSKLIQKILSAAKERGLETKSQSNMCTISGGYDDRYPDAKFDIEFTTIGGKNLEEKLDPNSTHGKGMTDDYYQMILFVFDPSKYQTAEGNNSVAYLNEVITKIKKFAPKPQFILVYDRSKVDENLGDLISNNLGDNERKYKDPYGYQDFIGGAVDFNNGKKSLEDYRTYCNR